MCVKVCMYAYMYVCVTIFFVFFSLFHQRADDEALTRLLQTSLFLVALSILVKSMFFSFTSSLTLSIQIFLCLPLLRFSTTCPCKAAIGSLSTSIRSTCPNHWSLDHCFLSHQLFCGFFHF